VLGLATQAGPASASADGTNLTFGGDFAGDPSNSWVLQLENTASSNFQGGLKITSQSPSSYGIESVLPASTGGGIAVLGRTASSDGQALRGVASAKNGNNRGVTGITESPDGRGVQGFATAKTGNTIGFGGRVDSNNGTGVFGNCVNGSGSTVGIEGKVASPDGVGVRGNNTNGGLALEALGNAKINGNLEVTGTKNFVQAVDTESGIKRVAYNAVEAGRARTEADGVGEMEDGRAVIDLPEHFGMVTSEREDLTVQVTAYAKEPVQPQVVERSTDRIVVEDFSDCRDDYSFGYTVKGIREGFEDVEVVRDR